MKEKSKLSTERIILYLVITFLLTYAVEIFVIAPFAGSTDFNEATIAQLLTTGVMFIPAYSVIMTRLFTKESFRKEELYLSLNLRGNLKYYGLAWFGFALLIVLGSALYFLIFPKQFDPNLGYVAALLEGQAEGEVTTEALKSVMSLQIVIGILFSPVLNFLFCLGEEWGWRGYLLPKLLEKFPVTAALLLEGVIWGLWHAPLTVLGHNYGVGYPGFPVVGILAMCCFCIVIGIILSYVTIKTRSCIPAVLGHAMINGFSGTGIYFTSLENPYNVFLGPASTGLIGGAGFIVLAVVLLIRLHRDEKRKA